MLSARIPISDFFDIVVGFAGSSTIPGSVACTLTKFLAEVVIEQEHNPWAAASRVFSCDHSLLKHVPVVLIYVDPTDEKRKVISRCIGFHSPPLRVFGAEFIGCATQGCNPQARDIVFQTKHNFTQKEKVRQYCLPCGWKSVWINWKELGFLQPIGPSQPRVYWHTFPMTPLQCISFVAISLSKGEKGKGVNERVGYHPASNGACGKTGIRCGADNNDENNNDESDRGSSGGGGDRPKATSRKRKRNTNKTRNERERANKEGEVAPPKKKVKDVKGKGKASN